MTKASPREFSSLDEIQKEFLPEFSLTSKGEDMTPRIIGARLAKEALAQVSVRDQRKKKKPNKGA